MKITVFIGIATSVAAVVIAAGCGSSANGSAYSSGSYRAAAVRAPTVPRRARDQGRASQARRSAASSSTARAARSTCSRRTRTGAAPATDRARRTGRRSSPTESPSLVPVRSSRFSADPTRERQPAGHLRGSSPIPVRARPEAGPDERRRPAGLRRKLGCRLTRRQEGRVRWLTEPPAWRLANA